MANDLTSNPIVLDTASTSVVLISKQFRVTKVVWAGGAIAAANTMVLKDQNGKTKVEMGTSTADDHKDMNFTPPLKFDGLIAHTIAAGTVYVYVDPSGPKPQS